MAGGVGTGLYVTGHCFCCCYDSFEEIDVPRRPNGKSDRRPTMKAVRADVDFAKNQLIASHRQRGCEVAGLAFGFSQGHAYRQDVTGVGATAQWAEKIINGGTFRRRKKYLATAAAA